MRVCRILAVLGLAAALSLPAAASAAETRNHVGLHDMTCTSITAMGKGLTRNSAMQLTLTNRGNGSTLAGQTVRTSAKGDFMVKLPARLNRVLSIRLTVSRPDGTKVAFADHVMAKGAAMCDLPFTGPSRTVSLLLAGTAALGLGLVLVATAARRERILARVTALEAARFRLPRG
ncbi:MAG TPA: hypothetical protein VHM23_12120 [Actinomycetota bacterium]|jgi:hypothetical protein|nr:hypothetical protein [Actinomycetota bacterium]